MMTKLLKMKVLVDMVEIDNNQIFEDEIEEVGTSEIKESSLEERMKEMMSKWKIETKSIDDPQTEKEIEEEKNWQVKFLENAYKDYYPLAVKSEKAKEINEQKKYTKLENALNKVGKFNRKMLLLLTNLKRLEYIQKQLQIYENDRATEFNDKPIKDLRTNFNLLKEGNFETYLIVVNICKNINKLFENNDNELKKYYQFCYYQKHGVNCIFEKFGIVYTEEDEKDEQEVINFIENFIKEEIKKVKGNKKDLKKNNRGRIIKKQ
ncbi:hypothetical protein Mgra_00006550, partial [Meloidogyne graminicola]